MYRAKERGRGRIEMFDEALRLKAERRLATASALHRALERDEFIVHYQPVVDLTTGAMVSAEALLRWKHPEHGLVDARRVHLPRRGDRPHRADRRLGARAGVPRTWPMAGTSSSSGSDSTLSIAVNLSVRQMLAPGHRRA